MSGCLKWNDSQSQISLFISIYWSVKTLDVLQRLFLEKVAGMQCYIKKALRFKKTAAVQNEKTAAFGSDLQKQC